MIRHIIGLGVFVGVAALGFYLGQLYTDSYNDMQFLQELNNRFANAHNYDINSYNCVNYSQDYISVLKHLGYNTEQITQHNGTHGHAWVKLYLEIEPITGKIVKNSDIYPLEYQK